MVKLRALIFCAIMYLYWGYQQDRNYASMNNIPKIMIFLQILHLHFLAHIHVKDTNFIFGTPTHNADTHRHNLHFCSIHAKDTHFIFGTPHRHAQIHTTWHTVHDILQDLLEPTHFIFSCQLPNELRSTWSIKLAFWRYLEL